MKFKIGDKVKTVVVDNDYFNPIPVGTIGTISDVDDVDDEYLPYEVTIKGCKYWFAENKLALVSEESEETEMPKQKNLYDFDDMTDDDLEMLINKANEAKAGRILNCFDNAIDILRELQALDHNTAMTSNGNTVGDIIYDIQNLKAYYE